jgi:PleD family two-component response regulator
MENQLPTPTNYSVLLIQGDATENALVKMILQCAGMEVRDVDSAADAASVLDGFTPDIVIADWDIDGTDGRAIAREIRTKFRSLRETPAILMTDRTICQKSRREFIVEGFSWILQKPIVATSLPKLIAHTIQSKSPAAFEASSGSQAKAKLHVLDFGQTASGAFFKAVI